MIEREVLQNQFFPGFTFRDHSTKGEGLVLQTIESDGLKTDHLNILSIDTTENEIFGVEVQSTVEKTKVNFREIVTEFNLTNKKIEVSLGNIFQPNIALTIVTEEEMKPKTQADREWLIDRYGTYMQDGSSASFGYLENGTPLIRLGYLGLEERVSGTTVLHSLAHEMGHSLGGHIL